MEAVADDSLRGGLSEIEEKGSGGRRGISEIWKYRVFFVCAGPGGSSSEELTGVRRVDRGDGAFLPILR